MIPIRLDQIAKEIGGEFRSSVPDTVIERICTDSRGATPKALFFPLKGGNTDGHRFLSEAFRNGAAAAVVSETVICSVPLQPEWPIIVVASPLRALQLLAGWYRRETIRKVLAITGSNGKTTVKDALTALFASRQVVASPGSYNSQLGLPLSVLSADRCAELALLEVGVSEPGDMTTQERIALPDYGILTNIGMAHFAAFGSREAIAREKMLLFQRIPKDGWVLVPATEETIKESLSKLRCRVFPVGLKGQLLSLTPLSLAEDGQIIQLSVPSGESHDLRIKTRSLDILRDIHFAASAAYLLGMSLLDIASSLDGYDPVPTRMEFLSSPRGIRIINDAHTSDPISVRAALRAAVLGASEHGKKIFAFAGMRELGDQAGKEHYQVGAQAGEYGFSHLFLVGNSNLDSTAKGYKEVKPDGCVVSVRNNIELQEGLLRLARWGDSVLFKGPRNAGLARTARDLSGAVSQRCLRVDLAAIKENLARFSRHCAGRSKIIAMVKALAYGTDLVQLTFWMAQVGIQHLGVSSTDEAIAVRKAGFNQDIYVFISDKDDLDNLVRYRLIPILYSVELIEAFMSALAGTRQTLDVHLKLDTGMHRLGVEPSGAVKLAKRIRNSGKMRLSGICTHFASADDPAADDYTRQQISIFNQSLDDLRTAGFTSLVAHAANTAATIRFPQAHYDMVRVGLGLYGVYPSADVQEAMDLELAIAVTSRIASVRELRTGDSVGYNGTYTAKHNRKIGVIPFGYDDGLPWNLSGVGHVLVEGKLAPIIGRISMDQAQIDVTDIDGVDVGAEVLLYGSRGGNVLRPEVVAGEAGTIAHELLTRLGKRVHRIYLEP